LNRSLIFVALALLTWGFGEGMFFNFQPIYLKELGSSEQQIGIILGVFGASMAITHIPAGRLADRVGRRPLLVTAWIVGFLSTAIMAIARDLPLFIVGLLGYGLTAFVSSPLASYVTAARGSWSVGTALSLTTATFNTGMALGPLVGGRIGDLYGLRAVYFVAAGVFMLSLIFIFLVKAQPIDEHDPSSPPTDLSKNTKLIRFFAIVAFAVFAMYLAQPLTPNFLEGVRNLTFSNIGIIFAFGAFGNALLAVSLSRLKPYIGFLVSQIFVASFALLIWRGTGIPAFALGYFLLGGFRAARPIAMAQARALVHTSQMGLTYGVMETISAVIFILTPPLAGFLYEVNPLLTYPISLALIAVSLIVSAIAPRRLLHA
jgi:MFS family permease